MKQPPACLPPVSAVPFRIETGCDNANPHAQCAIQGHTAGAWTVRQFIEPGAPPGYSFHLHVGLCNDGPTSLRDAIYVIYVLDIDPLRGSMVPVPRIRASAGAPARIRADQGEREAVMNRRHAVLRSMVAWLGVVWLGAFVLSAAGDPALDFQLIAAAGRIPAGSGTAYDRMIVLDNFARFSQLADSGRIDLNDYQRTRLDFETMNDLALDRAARRLGLAVTRQERDPARPRGCGPRSDIDILIRCSACPDLVTEVVRQFICEENKRRGG